MLDYDTKKRQGNRVFDPPNALKKSVNQPKPPTEKYSGGWFGGLIGDKPLYPENSEFWCSQKGVELSERF